MAEDPPIPLQHSLTRFSRITAGLTMAVGVLVLLGWAFDVDALKAVVPGLATMKANTALAFVLSGTALWLIAPGAPLAGGARARLARGCAVGAALLGALSLGEYLSGWNLGIDELLYRDPAPASQGSFPGRMSPVTALNFTLLGAALVLVDVELRRGGRPAQWLVLVVAFAAFNAVVGYAYGGESLYRVGVFTSMALHTAVVFVAVSAGFLCARPGGGVMNLATDPGAGGVLVRRLILPAILVPPFVGWLRLLGERAGFYSFEFGLALFAMINVVIFVSLVWWTAGSLRATDAERLKGVNALAARAEELARSREDLQHSNEELVRSNVELQQYAYIASHDLQTPLRNISGFVQLLQQEYAGQLDAQAADYIARTVRATGQMQTLIRDLLAYSRVESRSRPFERVPFRKVFDAAVAQLEASIRDAGGQVTHEELPTVAGDRAQFVQLLVNLIGNGLKYHGPEAPHVHVSATRDGDAWCFAVRDNGIGIAPQHQERIFEIFRRLHSEQEYPGTGIGLAVCRRVVHRHHGRLWVESAPGQGSTFFFTIPEMTRKPTP